jgi:hypothetical protein
MDSNLHLDKITEKNDIIEDPMNGWTDRKVSQLKKKMDQLKILRYLHKKVSSDYSKLNDGLSLPNITIEAIISASLFVSLSEKVSDNARFWINMILGILALIGTILGIWVKYFKAGDKMHEHSMASKAYSDIYDDIDDQLSMEAHERINGKEFLTYIKKMINQQTQNQLDISQKYWDDYFESVSKGELINLNYTMINQDNQKDPHTIIQIEPTIITDDNTLITHSPPDTHSPIINNHPDNHPLTTPSLNTHPLTTPSLTTPQLNSPLTTSLTTPLKLSNNNDENDDENLGVDMVKMHFNKMSATNLKKNLQFQMARFGKL